MADLVSEPVEVTLIDLAAEIVSVYVGHNALSPADLPKLIGDVYAALQGLATTKVAEVIVAPKPAVSIRKSITPDYLICLEDGRKFKSMKRHLATTFHLTPDAYRAKWGLAPDYPMVAPSYSAARSSLARSIGLGRTPAAQAAPFKTKRSKATV